jgi:hypothetical protein
MSTWVGMGPVIGPGSLDGFAIGVMMSGAVFMAVTTQRRTRRRPAVAAGCPGMLTAGPRDWLTRHPFRRPRISQAPRVSEIPRLSGACEMSGSRDLDPDAFEPGPFEPGAPGPFEPGAFEPGAFEAGAFGPGPFGAGPFAPGAERLARPDEPGAYSDTGWHLTVGDDGRVAGGHRSRHRLNEPLPGAMSPDRTPRGGTSRDSGPRGRAVTGGARRSGGGFPDSAFPESALPGREFPETGFPETGFPDVSFPDQEPRDVEWLDELPGVAPRDAGGLDPLPPDRAPRDRGRLEPPFPDWASGDDRPFPNRASRERGRPDVEFPDVAFPDGTFGTSKRPEPRRLPRHAAPAVGLGSKVSHWMTGLFASSGAGMGRWAGSGARS